MRFQFSNTERKILFANTCENTTKSSSKKSIQKLEISFELVKKKFGNLGDSKLRPGE